MMERASLDGIQPAALPPGVRLRHYRPGDDAEWTRIQAAADRFNRITPELFSRAFGSDQSALAERMLFAEDADGHVVGTAAAWWGDGPRDPWGRVHWVAVLPEWEGRGIGRALVTAVCGRMRELGHTRAFLATSAARLRAIRLYRALGFVPQARTDEERAAWREIDGALSAGGS